MGTYRPVGNRPEVPSFSQRTKGPAAWGGIGCIMAVLLPVLAYYAALVTMEYNAHYHWFAVPPSLTARPAGLPVSIAIVILTAGYAVIFYGIYATLYALLYRMAGISPYTPLDLERPERKRRRISQVQVGKIVNVMIFLLALAGGVMLVNLNLTHGWFPIPPDWQVPGPVPYAGVYLLVFLLLWALLWAFLGVLQGVISALFYQKEEESTRFPGDEF